MPTFWDTSDVSQQRNVAMLASDTYRGADPAYVSDLKSGFESGKYSYEDVVDAYGRLNEQQGPEPPTTTGGGGGGGGGGDEPPLYDGDSSNNWFTSPISGDIYNLAKSQIAYTSRRLGEIGQARKLADMTGTLTSSEKQMFDEMEQSAVANLKSQVNAETQDVWDSAIADLVNRGVLQGTVGENILGEIGSESLRMIAEGVNTIRGTKNAQMLSTIEGNKNRAMNWQQMLTSESLGLLGVGSGYANQQSGETQAGENRELQAALGQLQATVAYAGLKNASDIASLNANTNKAIAALQANTTTYGLNLDAQTRLQIAAMNANASTTSSKYGAYGNLGVAGAGLALKITDTDWFKKLWTTDPGGSGSITSYVDPGTSSSGFW